MRLIVLHGLPAVGKKTVGEELARITGYPLFHNHLVVDPLLAVFPFGSKPFRELREKMWIDVMTAAAQGGREGLIFTFSPDNTVSPKFFQKLKRALVREESDAKFVELVCTPAVRRKRMLEAERGKHRKLQDPEMDRRLEGEGAFKYRGVPKGMRLDITAMRPEEAAIEIMRKIDSASR